MPIIKYDSAIRSRLLELSHDGYSITDMAKLLGVQRATIYRWIKRDGLEEPMKQIKLDGMRSAIEKGLLKLTEGAKTTESVRETVSYDEDGRPSKITEKIRVLAPSEKAMQILAQRYAKDLSRVEVLADGNSSPVSININTSTMSLRELQAIASPLGSVKTSKVVEVVPPEEDSEG